MQRKWRREEKKWKHGQKKLSHDPENSVRACVRACITFRSRESTPMIRGFGMGGRR